MDKRIFQISVNGYKGTVDRVSKPAAEKAFNSGQVVFLLGVNLRPGMMWQPCPIMHLRVKHPKEYFAFPVDTFKTKCNNFSYYNCDSERGYYPAFYLLRG